MKYIHFTSVALISLIISVNLSAQTIPYGISAVGMSLYNADGDLLTDEQVKELSDYGFDYNQYLQLKRNERLSTAACFTGGALILGSGVVKYLSGNKPLSNSMEIIGGTMGFLGIAFHNISAKRVKELISQMDDSPQLSFTPSGFGLVYTF